MIYCLDTSVVVRLLTGKPAHLCAVAKKRLASEQQARNPVYVSDVAVVEAYYAMKYHYGREPEEIRAKLRAMLESGLVSPEPGSGALAALTEQVGSTGIADRIIHQRHRELGGITLTFDERQAKLPGAEYLLRR